MNIKIFGYSISLNVLILMGILYLIIVLHAISGSCDMEGMSTADTTLLKNVSSVEEACNSTLDKIQLLTKDPEVLSKIKSARSIKTLPPSLFSNPFSNLSDKNPDGTDKSWYDPTGYIPAAEKNPDGTDKSWYGQYIPAAEKNPDGTDKSWYDQYIPAAEKNPDGTDKSWYGQYIPDGLPFGGSTADKLAAAEKNLAAAQKADADQKAADAKKAA